MAWTEFGTNDAQTRKVWGRLTMHQILRKTFFRRFMGTSDNAIVQRIMDLEQDAGDEVKYDLCYQMRGFGVDGDAPLKGFETQLRYAQDSVKIDQKRIGHRFARMSQQRTIHDLRKHGRMKLGDRYAEILDLFFAAMLSGTAGSGTDEDTALAAALPFAGNALQAPDAAHTVTHTAVMDTDAIDKAVERAKTLQQQYDCPNLRPANFEGAEKYVMLLHPFSVINLRIATGSSKWREITALANTRGDRNPLYSGALGEWNNVILHEWERIRRTNATPLTHNLFLGSQAAVFAMGNAYDRLDQARVGRDNFVSWWEDNGEDYGNQKGVAVGAIFGIKKCRFTDPEDATATARDFGVIRVDTQCIAH